MIPNTFPYECKACGNAWAQPVPLPMDMAKVAKFVRKVRCPKCDAGEKSLLVNFGRIPPQKTAEPAK